MAEPLSFEEKQKLLQIARETLLREICGELV